MWKLFLFDDVIMCNCLIVPMPREVIRQDMGRIGRCLTTTKLHKVQIVCIFWGMCWIFQGAHFSCAVYKYAYLFGCVHFWVCCIFECAYVFSKVLCKFECAQLISVLYILIRAFFRRAVYLSVYIFKDFYIFECPYFQVCSIFECAYSKVLYKFEYAPFFKCVIYFSVRIFQIFFIFESAYF